MLNVILENDVRVVSFHFGVPSERQIAQLREAGVLLLGTATTISEALALSTAGINVIVAQGVEAGGHRGVSALLYL